jgi:hypothetical protein
MSGDDGFLWSGAVNAPGKREQEWWARKSFAHPTICPFCGAATAPRAGFFTLHGVVFDIFVLGAVARCQVRAGAARDPG